MRIDVTNDEDTIAMLNVLTDEGTSDEPTVETFPPSEEELSSDKDESQQREGQHIQHKHKHLSFGGWATYKEDSEEMKR